jgi:hypothetical protein
MLYIGTYMHSICFKTVRILFEKRVTAVHIQNQDPMQPIKINNATIVKTKNITNSLVRCKKIILSSNKKHSGLLESMSCSCKCNSRRIGSRKKNHGIESYDHCAWPAKARVTR